MSADSVIAFWSVQSIWWTFALFFGASLVEMWFPPFPGDTIYFVGLASLTAGKVSVVGAFSAALLGSLFGFATLYWLGRAQGHRVFERRTRGLCSPDTLARIQRWFDRWGGWVIVCGRFLSGVRSAVPLAAGVAHYPQVRALTFGTVSILIWNGLLASGALVLGHNWESVARVLKTYNLVFWALVGIALLVWGTRRLVRRLRSRRR